MASEDTYFILVFLATALIYWMLTHKWTYTTELQHISIPKAQHEASSLNALGYKHPEVVADAENGNENEWKIVYDEQKLWAEVQSIHDSSYKVKDGDKCTKGTLDCMIVGVAKCGTIELTDFMTIHPNIVTRTRLEHGRYQLDKDVFSKNESAARLKLQNQMPCKYPDQVSVAKADQFLRLESKPSELFRLNPNMKIIAIIREPIARIISLLSYEPHTYNTTIIQDSNSMNRWFNKTIQNLRSTPPAVVETSTYDTGLERYLELFKRDNILVIESNEFKADPVSVLRRIEVFLGIPNFVSDEYFAFNHQKKFYCIRMTKSVSKRMVCYESNRGRKMPIEIDDENMEAMRNYFRPHNENLYRLIGKRYDW